MRWDHLKTDADRESRLPGYRDPAVVRTFDAPQALDTRFYEIRARTVINRVPERSRMPFRWTINPYRGCSHACTYCASGETQILMSSGRTKRLADLRPGDEILGSKRMGRYRKLLHTVVLDHWSTIKPAYRVTLANGTELITSGDHRFLSDRGWKHVTGSQHGPEQRPHLAVGNRLLGVGGTITDRPRETIDYRRGYLCGLIRGDGHLGSYAYPGPQGNVRRVHRFRLALTDLPALERAELYLAAEGIGCQRFRFSARTAERRPVAAIRTSRGAHIDQIEELCRWPLDPSDDWRKGFLAGIFDAEGSCGKGVVLVANTDPQILGWTEASLRHFGFDTAVDRTAQANGLAYVRLRGGIGERLRFFHLVDPAITRKNRLAGRALKTGEDLRVLSIEPLGVAMRLYDVTTGTGDFIANGVVSHNCFARPTHEFLDFGAGRDFEREIVVKVNAPEVLRAELARPSWQREHIAMGTNTDPYQWVEGRYRLMRGIWEALADARNPASILTKSPLLLRDLDLITRLAERTPVHASLSIPTVDEKAWRATEPHTPSPKARLEAVRALNDAGIPTGILVAPLMPGINDAPEQVQRILDGAREARATSVAGIPLHLRGSVRDVFFDWLRSERPDLVGRYERLYADGRAYVPVDERRRLAALLAGAPRADPRRWRDSGLARSSEPDQFQEALQTSLF